MSKANRNQNGSEENVSRRDKAERVVKIGDDINCQGGRVN